MIETGIIREGARIELIEGELVEMATIGTRHFACVNRLAQLFFEFAQRRYIVSVQNPLRVNGGSEPQPDIALLKPRTDFYEGSLPTPEDVLLLVEVSDTTLRYDRDIKLPLYARTGIPEVWIVDLNSGTVEVHDEPLLEEGRYALVRSYGRGEEVDSRTVPGLELPVRDILGRSG
jgi:Uma2 family endonuclease